MSENSTNELLIRMEEKYKKMSKGQKRLADYVTENYDKAVFLTAARLGEVVGVSESTVVRFATQLGYKGYPGFQKALEELVRNKLNSIQRMEVTYGRISQSEILETVLQSDIEKIKLTLAGIDQKAFELAIDTILSAKRIYVVGIRSCAPLASFLCFYLNLVCENVTAVNTNSSSEIFEQLIRINEEDVIIGISFPRYSMRTLKALEFASNRKAKVITLTDSVHSPMNLYSSCNLIARSDMASIVDSLVAPLSVINALVVALCMKKLSNLTSQLKEQGAEDKFYEVLEEVPRVRKDLGEPPLVTPSSQIVGTQAVFNVLMGERYKMATKETKDVLSGKYGATAKPFNPEVQKKVIGEDAEVITCRPADLIPNELDTLRNECAQYSQQDEDVLTYALFPQVATDFFKYRDAQQTKVDAKVADTEDGAYPV